MISQNLAKSICQRIGKSHLNASISNITGGDVSQAYKFSFIKNEHYFVKVNSAKRFAMFRQEQLALESINAAVPFSTPKIIDAHTTLKQSFLILEFIEPELKTNEFWSNLAKNLVSLHQKTEPYFGFHQNNFIGSLNQVNTKCNNWIDFFILNRIRPQAKIAFNNHLLTTWHLQKLDTLYLKLNSIFPIEKPALLHGDLWAGNVLCAKNQKALFIDPASYFGHREMDLAFSLMFGGFNSVFYDSYSALAKLEPNFAKRVPYYNLYPTLVHLNLFGKSYLSPIEQLLKSF
ncbi:MAG: fructosamine kinase family protein [Bacteroidia bacterium]